MKKISADLLETTRCFVLPGSPLNCQKNYYPIHRSTYRLWYNIMQHTLQHDSKLQEPKLMSDTFLTQDEIISIVKDNQSIGLLMLTWIDITHPSIEDYSYFCEKVPSSVLDILRSKNIKQLIIMSNMVIDPNWRKSKIGAGLVDCLLRFAVLRFQGSQADRLIAYTRNDRNMHKNLYRHGGVRIINNFSAHGIPSDVIEFEKKSLSQTIHYSGPPSNLIDALWASKKSVVVASTVAEQSSPDNAKLYYLKSS